MTISPNKWELDVQGYLNVCNITAELPRQQIRDFSAGVNALGLWNSMVCWPLRSSQNSGNLSAKAFSLGGLGTFDGTLVNGPTWGDNGIAFTQASSHYISTTLAHWIDEDTFAFCVAQTSATNVGAFSSRTGGGGAELWARNSTALSILTRNSASGTANATANLAWPATGSRYIAANYGTRSAKAFVEGSLSGANYSSATATTGTGQSQGGNWHIGGYAGLSDYSGTIPMCGIVRGNVNQSQNEQLYSLYKSTLGQGLTGLP